MSARCEPEITGLAADVQRLRQAYDAGHTAATEFAVPLIEVASDIVRALAECDGPVVEGSNGNDHCLLCSADGLWIANGSQSPPSDHDAACPWRRAWEWAVGSGEG